jgi:hypothetical protein
MRHMKAVTLLFAVTCGAMFGQGLVEYGAAAAGGSVGGVAGKKVSDGVSGVLNKVSSTTTKAAATAKSTPATGAPLIQAGPGRVQAESVPPPPVHRAAAHKSAPELVRNEPINDSTPVQIEVAVLAPPPPVATADDLKNIEVGGDRADVLKLGPPASRITMFDNGHLVEIYRYMKKDTTFGVVRLSDGSVSSVELH